MLPQARLVTATGTPIRMDDALGDWFAIIGLDVDPRESLTFEQQLAWERLGAKYVLIRSAGQGHPKSDDEYVDYKDELCTWMRKFGVQVVVLRPDRFIAATDNSGLNLPPCGGRAGSPNKHDPRRA